MRPTLSHCLYAANARRPRGFPQHPDGVPVPSGRRASLPGMRARTRTESGAKPRARTGAWWVAIPLLLLLVAAAIVSANALGRARGDTVPPAPGSTTSPAAAQVTTPPTKAAATTAPVTPSSAPASASPAPTQTRATTTSPTSPASQLPRVTVVVVTASGHVGAVSVSGYAGVVEDGGTCTLTLTHGGVTVTASTAASPDVTTTDCAFAVRDARLTPGTWQAVLGYTSAKSTGASTPTSMTIG